MNSPEYNHTTFADFSRLQPSMRFNLVEDAAELSRKIAREAVDAIKAAGRANRQILMILPVGPLDYKVWADLCNQEQVSCEPLVTLNMDEYLTEKDVYIARDHPLSFRGFMQANLVDRLQPKLRPRPENVRFPDPAAPEATTEMVDAFGGADLCFGGMGITGHLAFNDPPEPGDPVVDDEVRCSRTRLLTINRESATQMAMGGVAGNWDILPRRAITVGMHELLRSRKQHLTFMRSWHAGVLRRALFGPVTGRCPGSFVQRHSHVEVTVTRIAAAQPLCNVAQAIGETQAA